MKKKTKKKKKKRQNGRIEKAGKHIQK